MSSGARFLRSARVWLSAALASALVASWAWWPHAGWGAQPRASAVLVDVSASVVRTRPGWSAWRDEQLAQELGDAAQLQRRVLVAAFAEGFELLAATTSPRSSALERLPESLLRDGASELAGALRALEDCVGDSPLERLLVLSDGRFTGPDPSAAIDAWRRRGVEVELRSPATGAAPDLELAELRAPRELEQGAPLAFAARVRSLGSSLPHGARAWLEALVRDERGERLVRTPLDERALASGEVFPRVDVGALAHGLTALEVRVVLDGARDVVPENDLRVARVRSRGALVVRVVAPRPGRYRAWLDALSAVEGLQLLAPIDAFDAAALEHCDVLLTLDLDPRELDGPSVRAFVASGGGWLALGQHALAGAKSGGESAPGAADATELLPLELRERPARDVVLLLDGSGSMDAAALAELRAASLELARAAAPRERLRLWWFTDRLREAFELEGGVAAQARERNRAVWSRQNSPGGPTDLLAVLEQFARQRQGARDTLAFVVTDGRDQRADESDAARREALFAELTRANVRLALIAAGAQADRAWLDELARRTPHGRAWNASDGDLIEVLAREAVREQLAPQGGDVAVVASPESSAVSSAESSAPEAVALREAWASSAPLPRAGPVLLTRARERDELVAELVDGLPWLALRRYGLGWSAVLTGEPVASSSAEWERAAALFAPLVRLLGRAGASESRARPHARRDELGRWRIEGLPVELAAALEVADAARPAVRVPARLPHELNARDPRAQRIATGLDAGQARELVLYDATGNEVARAWVERAPAEEFRGAAARLGEGVLPALEPLASRGRTVGPARARLGFAAAVFALAALGLALTCSNLGPGRVDGQVGGPSRR